VREEKERSQMKGTDFSLRNLNLASGTQNGPKGPYYIENIGHKAIFHYWTLIWPLGPKMAQRT